MSKLDRRAAVQEGFFTQLTAGELARDKPERELVLLFGEHNEQMLGQHYRTWLMGWRTTASRLSSWLLLSTIVR